MDAVKVVLEVEEVLTWNLYLSQMIYINHYKKILSSRPFLEYQHQILSVSETQLRQTMFAILNDFWELDFWTCRDTVT